MKQNINKTNEPSMTKYILALTIALGALPISSQAVDFLTIDARVQTSDGTLIDQPVYITSDGCTVADDAGTEHEISGAQAICVAQYLEDIGMIDAVFGYYDGIGLYLSSLTNRDETNYTNDSVNYSEYWSYFVNYVSPSVGMDAFELTDGDSVVIAFGPYTTAALRIRTSDTEILSGEPIVARVQMAANDTGTKFTPVSGATVMFNDTTVTTDAYGKASYKPTDNETSVEIVASSEDALTSATETITIVERNKTTKILMDEQLATMADLGVQKIKDSIDPADGLVLGSQSISEWSAIALAAHGTAADRLTQAVLAYEPTAADGTNELARHILALVAIGEDPYDTNDIDYVARLKKTKSGNQFGNRVFVNDDIFAGLALLAVGESGNSADVRLALRAAKAGLNQDGGVAFGVSAAESDVDTTAFFFQFVTAADNAGNTVPITAARRSALAFLRAEQNLDGGYGYSHGETSNSATTAVVMQAFNSTGLPLALEINNLRSPNNFLKTIQKDNGQFSYNEIFSSNYDLLNTAYAVIALNGVSLPYIPETTEQ